ncbi:dTDP-4-dehydrorhamnose 3,5-epimerase [Streptomyces rimosus subsp. pseudoverticillatus]|uniref:dTDP-4-dehydrorhamnose 3,5-epimerase family protein n=1 Tax=Streptomyces rimosus TaxID=1927 RepID=UPI0006B27896|nr:dTDP-4-dehydrorhamnose 3,5-epimerase [Streptomyces rimosus]KOT80909.1 dTDP-4-dehydrorhamnose 3,5-epimerase [Streptomyces rimosus subsp. pseudoverticillatus]
MRPLSIDGAWLHEPVIHHDERGAFHEWFRAPDFLTATGTLLELAQANCSVSRRGALRGIHFADIPPGQAKYVTCLRGAVLDVVIDVRVGSPTFGQHETVRLDDASRRAVYLSPGLGHAFLALTDDATVVYLCSTGYQPEREHGVHPLDPSLNIAWPDDLGTPVLLSAKDAAAPTLEEARRAGILPQFATCRATAGQLRRAGRF